jgi:hypothetical protein
MVGEIARSRTEPRRRTEIDAELGQRRQPRFPAKRNRQWIPEMRAAARRADPDEAVAAQGLAVPAALGLGARARSTARQGLIASPECRPPLTRISDSLARRLDDLTAQALAA